MGGMPTWVPFAALAYAGASLYMFNRGFRELIRLAREEKEGKVKREWVWTEQGMKFIENKKYSGAADRMNTLLQRARGKNSPDKNTPDKS